ncbi:hypothetical protein PENCOP_c001G08159 [Penicillium coprophilum]|uniref:Uncharacterized protein n=1 Tax=Penicillium coprophilum TaxID=36646 RepID=A0A1V6V7R1_9EURO|nr:hypothetical protein PENCOP_c001G08159 [Penicillium coprophilum]
MVEYLYQLDYEVRIHYPETDVVIGLDNWTLDTDTDTRTDSTEALSKSAGGLMTSVVPISVHILMYSLADRMFNEGLKVPSKNKAEQELGKRLNSKIFPHAIAQIKSSTPESDQVLRDTAIKITKELRMPKAEPGQDKLSSAFPNSLVKSFPQFTSDLAVKMREKTVSLWNCYGAWNM